MPRQSKDTVAVLGVDIGKNTFHLVGLNKVGAIVLRLKLSRRQLEARLANLPPCLVGMEACVGAHHLSRRLKALGHDARLMPARYVRAYLKGNKNDFRDAEAIAEAVQRPTMRFVATKTAEQLDLQALHRVRSRLVGERTAIANEIRAFLLDRGIAVAKGLNRLRAALPGILATRSDALSPRLLHIIEDLVADWRHLDERIANVSLQIEALASRHAGCERLMTVPGIGPIISSATVAAIGTGDVFAKRRDFSAWLGLVPKQISTGDRTILGKISKRGNTYLRTLFVQAARVVLLRPRSWERQGLKPWIAAAAKRLHHLPCAVDGSLKGGRFAMMAHPEHPPVDDLTVTQTGYEVRLAEPLDAAYARRTIREQLDALKQLETRANGAVRIATSSDEIAAITGAGSFAIVLHLEGADSIDADLLWWRRMHACMPFAPRQGTSLTGSSTPYVNPTASSE